METTDSFVEGFSDATNDGGSIVCCVDVAIKSTVMGKSDLARSDCRDGVCE